MVSQVVSDASFRLIQSFIRSFHCLAYSAGQFLVPVLAFCLFISSLSFSTMVHAFSVSEVPTISLRIIVMAFSQENKKVVSLVCLRITLGEKFHTTFFTCPSYLFMILFLFSGDQPSLIIFEDSSVPITIRGKKIAKHHHACSLLGILIFKNVYN